MDFKRIRATQSKADRQKEIRQQIKDSQKDSEFKLEEIFKFFALGGSLVFKPLQDSFYNQNYHKTFYFQILEIQDWMPKGIFLANIGEKSYREDPFTGEPKKITTRDRNKMRTAYELTKDPSEHYILFDELEIDSNNVVKCNLKSAIALVMHCTNLFDHRKQSIVKELSEKEYEALSKKSRKAPVKTSEKDSELVSE